MLEARVHPGLEVAQVAVEILDLLVKGSHVTLNILLFHKRLKKRTVLIEIQSTSMSGLLFYLSTQRARQPVAPEVDLVDVGLEAVGVGDDVAAVGTGGDLSRSDLKENE